MSERSERAIDTSERSERVVVVTGATRGIGRAIAEGAAATGASLVIGGRTTRDAPHSTLPGSVEGVAEELAERYGVPAIGVPADLSDESATAAIVARTLDEYGRCDVLVNNAAYNSAGSMLDVPWQRWGRAFRVNVVAPHQLCHGFVPGMIERGAGAVLNISTGASQSLLTGFGLYSTSKLAMEHWSDFLAAEVAPYGVAVNTLRVDRIVATEGWYHTAATRGLDVASGGAGVIAPVTSQSVAAAALWMLDQPASWTGHTLVFDDVEALGGPALELADFDPDAPAAKEASR